MIVLFFDLEFVGGVSNCCVNLYFAGGVECRSCVWGCNTPSPNPAGNKGAASSVLTNVMLWICTEFVLELPFFSGGCCYCINMYFCNRNKPFWEWRNQCSVLHFQPKYRLGHPENYSFSLSKNIFWIIVSKKHFM